MECSYKLSYKMISGGNGVFHPNLLIFHLLNSVSVYNVTQLFGR
jgi:hypothetical protein